MVLMLYITFSRSVALVPNVGVSRGFLGNDLIIYLNYIDRHVADCTLSVNYLSVIVFSML